MKTKKLKHLRGKLKCWANKNYGKVESRVKKWEGAIMEFGTIDELFRLSEEEEAKCREAEHKLHEDLNDEERFWSQRAHKNWIKQEDRYTYFFHK